MKNTERPEQKPAEPKKIIIPPKSPKLPKAKKPNFLVRKLKLKSKSPPRDPQVSFSLPSTSVGRQTPEGDDGFRLPKSVSETNLTESRKSAGNSAKDNEPTVESRRRECVEVPERAQSLEALKDMPAYGDLIVDPAPAVITCNNFLYISIDQCLLCNNCHTYTTYEKPINSCVLPDFVYLTPIRIK
jgi:hypothetical protein